MYDPHEQNVVSKAFQGNGYQNISCPAEMLKKGMYSHQNTQLRASFQIKTFCKIYYKQCLQLNLWVSNLCVGFHNKEFVRPVQHSSRLHQLYSRVCLSDFPLNFVGQHQFCFFSCNNLTVIKSINFVFSVEVHKQATSVACSEHQ